MMTSKMVGGKGVTFAAVNAAAGLGAAGSTEDKADAAAASSKQDDVATTAEAGSHDASQEGAAAAAPLTAANTAMRTYAFRVKSAERIDAL